MKFILCYVLIGVLFLIILFLLIVMMRIKGKLLYLERRYTKLFQGEQISNMEGIILKRFAEIDVLKKNTNLVATSLNGISSMCAASLQKVGVVKFDAFDDVGGNLSAAICLLDRGNNGVILNIIHSTDRCMIYTKEVEKGVPNNVLTEEETLALNKALSSDNIDFNYREEI